MLFFERHGWYCKFLEEDCRTRSPRKLNFISPEKIIGLAIRGGAVLNLEGRQAIEHAISNGSGGVWLELMEEQ